MVSYMRCPFCAGAGWMVVDVDEVSEIVICHTCLGDGGFTIVFPSKVGILTSYGFYPTSLEPPADADLIRLGSDFQ